MDLARFPRRRYTEGKTPLERLDRLSAHLGGPTIYMKRDDLLARTEAILMDPVYTGKAMAGMIDLVRKGYFGSDETLCFVHTGGSPGLYAYLDAFLGDDEPSE